MYKLREEQICKNPAIWAKDEQRYNSIQGKNSDSYHLDCSVKQNRRLFECAYEKAMYVTSQKSVFIPLLWSNFMDSQPEIVSCCSHNWVLSHQSANYHSEEIKFSMPDC